MWAPCDWNSVYLITCFSAWSLGPQLAPNMALKRQLSGLFIWWLIVFLECRDKLFMRLDPTQGSVLVVKKLSKILAPTAGLKKLHEVLLWTVITWEIDKSNFVCWVLFRGDLSKCKADHININLTTISGSLLRSLLSMPRRILCRYGEVSAIRSL